MVFLKNSYHYSVELLTQKQKDFAENLEFLKASTLWKDNEKFRSWFQRKWEPQCMRWVKAFRRKQFLVSLNTTSGVESQNRKLKHEFLKDQRDKSLFTTLTVIVEKFLPRYHQLFKKKNGQCRTQHKKYNRTLPSFFHDRPRQFVMQG
ncbi:hypothetical protein GJAV_G00253270 [Gymnothorax javanicus]|nr:hypothetical protein GJAV_G00253270 [Gymnothorax javanicus]